MNTFAVEIWNDELKYCTFYTVRWDDIEANETDKFFEKFVAMPEYKRAAEELAFLLDDIGDEIGAVDDIFNRPENEVTGLPMHGRLKFGKIEYYYPNFPLRLYALKISEEIVILFNGGMKDAETNQNSSLMSKWREACAFAKKIIEAINENYIIIDEADGKLKLYSGEREILL